ncbi:uncharacterized protein AAEQ78_002440 [Lycaon pictus]
MMYAVELSRSLHTCEVSVEEKEQDGRSAVCNPRPRRLHGYLGVQARGWAPGAAPPRHCALAAPGSPRPVRFLAAAPAPTGPPGGPVPESRALQCRRCAAPARGPGGAGWGRRGPGRGPPLRPPRALARKLIDKILKRAGGRRLPRKSGGGGGLRARSYARGGPGTSRGRGDAGKALRAAGPTPTTRNPRRAPRDPGLPVTPGARRDPEPRSDPRARRDPRSSP